MSRKRDRKSSLGEEVPEDPNLPDLRNPFFDRLVRAALEGESSIEHLLHLCHKYGKQHGEAMRKKIENSSSYSKVYNNSRRLSRGQSSDPKNENSADDSGNNNGSNHRNSYMHPFYKMYHNSLTKSQKATDVDQQIPVNKRPSHFSANNSVSSAGIQEEATADSASEQSPASKSIVKKVEGMKGVEGYMDNRNSANVSGVIANRFMAFLTVMGRRIDLGEFPRDREAALAHDRSLIRALGPVHCPQDQLNFPISSYAHDPLESFMRYDTILKRALTGTSWDGLKDCDFGFLLTQALHKSPPKKRKIMPAGGSTPSNSSENATIIRSSTRSANSSAEKQHVNDEFKTQDLHQVISNNLYQNMKPPSSSNLPNNKKDLFNSRSNGEEDLYFR